MKKKNANSLYPLVAVSTSELAQQVRHTARSRYNFYVSRGNKLQNCVWLDDSEIKFHLNNPFADRLLRTLACIHGMYERLTAEFMTVYCQNVELLELLAMLHESNPELTIDDKPRPN